MRTKNVATEEFSALPSRFRVHPTFVHIGVALAVAAIVFFPMPTPAQTLAELGAAPQDIADSMPELIWATDGYVRRHPFFVSVEQAMLASGELDPALFSEGDLITIERDVLGPDFTECQDGFLSPGHSDPHAGWSDFDSILADSDFAVLGRVTGAKQGFWAPYPGTVFRIEPIQWLKSEDSWNEKYLFIPSAEMNLGGKNICFKDPRYADLPRIGWQVLIAYRNGLGNRRHPLFFVDPAQIIVIPPTGKVSLPKFLKERQEDWRGKNGERVVEAVKSLVRKDGSK